MSLTITLKSIKCLEEINESSASEEPYVLVTSAELSRRSRVWELPQTSMCSGTASSGKTSTRAKSGKTATCLSGDSTPTPSEINHPDDVALIVSLMENDNADPSQYATYVKTAATASLLASVGETNKKSRSTRLVQDTRNALDGVNFPIPFALDDDHIGTHQLQLEGDDLVPSGSRERISVRQGPVPGISWSSWTGWSPR
jgi:hypothetical protein